MPSEEDLLRNHPVFHFSDGNILILAPFATNAHTVFRVHQSLLARHSTVIRDMLADADGLTIRDGLPSLMLPIPTDRVECLLQFIYGDLNIPLRRLAPNDLSTINRLLQVSTQFNIPHIRKQLVPRVEQDWPPTLFHWDALEIEIEGLKNVWQGDPVPSYFDDYLPEPASAIRLGFECRIPSILPAAFYHLSRLTISQDRRALNSSDPETLSGHELSLRTADWRLLVASDFISLLKGQRRLSQAVEEMVFDEPRLCSLTKEHAIQGCSIDDQWELWKEIRIMWKNSRDVLHLLNEYAHKVQSWKNICYACRVDIQYALKHMRQEIWSKLAEYFDLKSNDTFCQLLS
ncbi:hypothetical protein APHAL10511_003581 [Amanita phalloides]|nr:hypothetical protein APHAL10511_003581 [Amanita phalloides]